MLPAMTRRMRLSVNVWTPQLNAFHRSEACEEQDVLRYFVDHDPNELIEESRATFRCHGGFCELLLSYCYLLPLKKLIQSINFGNGLKNV